MVNDFWLKNKHTISIFQAQVRDLAKHIEAQPKKQNAYKKKPVVQQNESFDSRLFRGKQFKLLSRRLTVESFYERFPNFYIK